MGCLSLTVLFTSVQVTARSPFQSADEWFACWTQVQEGLGSNRSHDAVR